MKPFRIIWAVLICAVIAGGLIAFNTVSRAHADTSTCIQYGGFSRSVSFIEAQAHGFFAQEGICVTYNQVANSTQQWNSILAGQYDIISTTADNVVNQYVNNNVSAQAIAGIDQGEGLDLIVNTANGIHSIADLKGKTIAVDAPTSGYVFALEKILSANGLSLQNGDYSLQVIGGSLQRYQALKAGTFNGAPVYATILGAPFSEQAHYDANLVDLAPFSAYVGTYQGPVVAVTQSYAQANSSVITNFLTAMILGRQFAANPANKATVIADIASSYSISTQIATDVYNDAVQNPATGENFAELVNIPGLMSTIDLRQDFGGFKTTVKSAQLAVPSGSSVYNDQYWIKAFVQAMQQSH
ncbi:ABC transporter substrate-binding protein [Ktedonobacter sp. SOSP1-52]|uniref:ABC transporter substrate-binding protein n=1 Tax=Ktedonobacter sp. SOSP1-52 TaxID=2778366 RepID=UPI001915460E|nr:ABC transporter substrate-binding protein [Ktedonobacter sp. SOSP1-52]GHO66664.1 ABC transporter substrate-binding protein [Ktedonobacter sp. SOSP1-52]